MIVEVFKCTHCGWSGSPVDVLYSNVFEMVQCTSCRCELVQYTVKDVEESIVACRGKKKLDPRYSIDKPY